MSKNIKHNWSQFQKKIFLNVAKELGYLIVEAYAGAAKTSTAIESFKYIPRGKKVLALAFNKIIQKELEERSPSYVETKTFHSLGLRAIKQRFGDIEIDDYKCFNIVKELVPDEKDRDLIDNICETISYCKYTLQDTPNQIDQLIALFGVDTCELDRKEFISLVVKGLAKCKAQTNKIDFNDMCYFPFVYNLPLGKYDYVYIDERQDLNKSQLVMALMACNPVNGRLVVIGDEFQCVDENTILNTEFGDKLIKDINVGEKVSSYENGKIVYRTILNKVNSNWDYGIKVTTASGKTITMSPTHKIWAEQQEIKNKFIVYLMYRHDLGFRVGKTNKWKANANPFGSRARHELADKLWVLEVVNSNEEAIYLEEYYSLQFGIPTSVFCAAERGLNQNRIDKIFENFGQNGYKLLQHKKMNFDYPHWIARSMAASRRSRLVVRLSSHGIGERCDRNSVNLELSDPAIIDLLQKNGITGKMYKRRPQDLAHFSIRKRFAKYTDALEFATKLVELTGAYLTENLSFGKEDDLRLITASALFVGMKIVSKDTDNTLISKDTIISIEEVPGKFIDIEVDGSACFFGNNILSHNSLYSWRAADTSIVDEIKQKPTTKILKLPISYRCPKKVISLAQNWVPDITCPDTAKEGNIEPISLNQIYDKAKPGAFILSRTNAPLIKICMNFIRLGVKANIRGRDVGKNLSFLIKKSKKKTIPAFLKWLEKWKDDESALLQSKNIPIENLLDRYECLISLCEDSSSLEEVKSRIDNLFNDTDDKNIIWLSSVHRAKGLETDDVFILRWTFRVWFDQMKFLEPPNEEANIAYVAVTRTKNNLYLVSK